MKVKSFLKPLPPLPPDEETESAITLKAWFAGCALCGAIASQEEA
jgi:hypothetical protein